CKAARGSPAVRAVACKGGRWQERPPIGAELARCHPRATTTTAGAVAHADSVHSRRLCRGRDGGDA
ncbi:hypothetical protein B296_00028534, partial [Ensete ventricosum]